jgi:hypothetical protein
MKWGRKRDSRQAEIDMISWLTSEIEDNRFFVMPEVLAGHPCVLNVDSRLQTAGMTDFRAYFRVNGTHKQ